MTSWFALSEPVVSSTVRVTVRLPRLKSKDERLRERAVAYVESTMLFVDDSALYGDRKRTWIEIRLSERKAVLKRVRRIPWWFPAQRRHALQAVLWTYGIPKWW